MVNASIANILVCIDDMCHWKWLGCLHLQWIITRSLLKWKKNAKGGLQETENIDRMMCHTMLEFIACFHVSIIHILIHISSSWWMFKIVLSLSFSLIIQFFWKYFIIGIPWFFLLASTSSFHCSLCIRSCFMCTKNKLHTYTFQKRA